MTTIVIGGGCFWCLDAVYRRIRGVESVVSGYSGGHDTRPNYANVCTGRTGHAEVVQLSFDETIIPLATVLDVFFVIHNPTTLNQQGADIGTQYRSIMLYTDDTQKLAFTAAIERAQTNWDDPIVTVVLPLEEFYPAEDEHQDYFNKHPEAGYCSVVINPKLIKARAAYAEWFND